MIPAGLITYQQLPDRTEALSGSGRSRVYLIPFPVRRPQSFSQSLCTLFPAVGLRSRGSGSTGGGAFSGLRWRWRRWRYCRRRCWLAVLSALLVGAVEVRPATRAVARGGGRATGWWWWWCRRAARCCVVHRRWLLGRRSAELLLVVAIGHVGAHYDDQRR